MTTPVTVGTVLEIWRYPVKSLRGEQVEAGVVSEQGLDGDRRWGVVDVAKGKVMSAKHERRLLEAAARLTDDGPPEVTLPSGRTLRAGDPTLDEVASEWLGREVRFEAADAANPRNYEHPVDPTDDDSEPFELTCPPGTFFDLGAVHLLTTASLEAARQLYPGGVWDRRRFRPTLLVDCDGPGFVEDPWAEATLRVGGVTLAGLCVTPRCGVTTRAQDEIPRDLEIVKTLNREHGSTVGIYLRVVSSGPVRIGDSVEVVL